MVSLSGLELTVNFRGHTTVFPDGAARRTRSDRATGRRCSAQLSLFTIGLGQAGASIEAMSCGLWLFVVDVHVTIDFGL
jgi:hypothetical protein